VKPGLSEVDLYDYLAEFHTIVARGLEKKEQGELRKSVFENSSYDPAFP